MRVKKIINKKKAKDGVLVTARVTRFNKRALLIFPAILLLGLVAATAIHFISYGISLAVKEPLSGGGGIIGSAYPNTPYYGSFVVGNSGGSNYSTSVFWNNTGSTASPYSILVSQNNSTFTDITSSNATFSWSSGNNNVYYRVFDNDTNSAHSINGTIEVAGVLTN